MTDTIKALIEENARLSMDNSVHVTMTKLLDAENRELREAISAFVEYDNSADTSSVDFVLLYNVAIEKARAVLAKYGRE